MTSSDGSFTDVMKRLRQGDDTAATQLFDRFASRLIALARSRLDKQLRAKVEPEDILQSVFKSFFRRYSDGHWDVRDWDGLWGLLMVITLRKCGRELRHFHRPGYDVRVEVPLAADDNSDSAWHAIARDPTPAEAAALAEAVEQLLKGLSDGDRHILELRLQGYTIPEISVQVKRTEYTVEGVLRRARKRLQTMRDATDPSASR
jgi:RNA polymerase sigma-70 factor (ECF subfamily)